MLTFWQPMGIMRTIVSNLSLKIQKKSCNFAGGNRQVERIFQKLVISLNMEQVIGLNKAQLGIMRLLSHFDREEQVKELNDLICSYYARKVDEEMDRLWAEGKWSQEKIDETLNEHLRTPYRYAKR